MGWIGVLINVDESSPQKNTISLFQDGKRVSEPQNIPESLIGKTLYPTFTYKSATLQVNFGTGMRKPTSFKCRMLSDASAADVDITAAPSTPKHEVLFPIGLPGHGLFDWLDMFLEEHPDFLELSDRKF